MKNNKGFTLIELLAVIIILGILMIIAIPSVTTYISNSRKSAYIDSVKNIIGAARNLVNSGKYEVYNRDVTYYIPVSCLPSENGNRTPYGEFSTAYVLLTYDGTGYSYYFTGNDTSKTGIKKVIIYNKLNEDNIESDVEDTDIKTDVGISGRSKIMILKDTCDAWDNETNSYHIIDDNGNVVDNDPFTYPEGKNKSTVTIGDIIRIDDQEFYVINNENDTVTMLARYNLKVGYILNQYGSIIGSYSKNDEGYGLQSSEAKGFLSTTDNRYGTIGFSSSAYWRNKVGSGLEYPGNYCTGSSQTNCAYVYDSNSNLYSHLNNYVEKLGITVKEIRLLTLEEAAMLRDSGRTSELYRTTFWIGNPKNYIKVWFVFGRGGLDNQDYDYRTYNGIRPVIVY